jgi:hypothetical protein
MRPRLVLNEVTLVWGSMRLSARIAALGCLIFASVLADAGAQESPRLLRITAPVGAAYVYDIKMRTDAVNADGDFHFDATLTQRMLRRTEDELTWSVAMTVANVGSRGVFAGIETNLRQLDGLDMTKITDARGQTRRIVVGDVNMPASGTPDVTFPEAPVAPGQSWIATVENQGRKAQVRYTFKGREPAGGRGVLLVEGVYEPGQFIKSVEPMIFRLDAAECTTISASGVMQVDLEGKIMRSSFTVARR